MFCKWCGKTIRATDECCPECGRQTPTLSDCGGLYDLKHSTAASVPATPSSAKCPLVDKLEARYEKDRRAARKHHTAMLTGYAVMIIVLLIVLVSSVLLTVRVFELKDEIDSMKDTSVSQNTYPTTDPDPSDTEEPGETEGPGETEVSDGTESLDETEDPGETESPDETEDPGETEGPAETTVPTDAADPTEEMQAESGTLQYDAHGCTI